MREAGPGGDLVRVAQMHRDRAGRCQIPGAPPAAVCPAGRSCHVRASATSLRSLSPSRHAGQSWNENSVPSRCLVRSHSSPAPDRVRCVGSERAAPLTEGGALPHIGPAFGRRTPPNSSVQKADTTPTRLGIHLVAGNGPVARLGHSGPAAGRRPLVSGCAKAWPRPVRSGGARSRHEPSTDVLTPLQSSSMLRPLLRPCGSRESSSMQRAEGIGGSFLREHI